MEMHTWACWAYRTESPVLAVLAANSVRQFPVESVALCHLTRRRLGSGPRHLDGCGPSTVNFALGNWILPFNFNSSEVVSQPQMKYINAETGVWSGNLLRISVFFVLLIVSIRQLVTRYAQLNQYLTLRDHENASPQGNLCRIKFQLLFPPWWPYAQITIVIL